MKSNLVCAALAALLLSSGGALAGHGCASGEHIKQPLCVSRVTIVVRDASGAVVGRGETGADGAARINVAVGDFDGDGVNDYTLEVDGDSFVKAVDRLDLDTPVEKPDGPSVTLGVGGFIGGGGHGHPNREGGSHHGSGGGVGLGVGIPLGGGHGDDPEAPAGYPITGITISLPANPDANFRGDDTVPAAQFLAINAPYCRDAAVHGTRLGFRLPRGGRGVVLVTMSIFDRWGNL